VKRALWTLGELMRATGWPLIGGAVLVVAAIAAHVALVKPVEDRAAQSRLADRSSRAQMKAIATPAVREPAEQSEQLAQFYDYFKQDAALTDVLAILNMIASAQGLTMTRGEYRLLPDQTLKLASYQITLPLAGSYPRVRAFVSLALARVPHLALEQVAYQRRKGPGAEVEAQVQFTYYFAER
jgi:hypothetical protein